MIEFEYSDIKIEGLKVSFIRSWESPKTNFKFSFIKIPRFLSKKSRKEHYKKLKEILIIGIKI